MALLAAIIEAVSVSAIICWQQFSPPGEALKMLDQHSVTEELPKKDGSAWRGSSFVPMRIVPMRIWAQISSIILDYGNWSGPRFDGRIPTGQNRILLGLARTSLAREKSVAELNCKKKKPLP